jgi:hypothetical protein
MSYQRDSLAVVLTLPFTAMLASITQASPFQGSTICEPSCPANPNPVCVFYPQGTLSFADAVLNYDPWAQGGPVPAPQYQIPSSALGVPDWCGDPGDVSLGNGGLIELAFTNNLLSNGGTAQEPFDLWIYEVGPNVETMDIFVRPTAVTFPLLDPALDPDGDGYFHVALIAGQPSGVDLDLTFVGFSPGQLTFDAVRIQDAYGVNQTTGPSVGADIDAVGAINSVPAVPIQPYCFGIGCPCGNDDATAGCQNSTGGGGALLATGSSLYLSDDLVLLVQGLPSHARGFVFMGPLVTSAPFADGLRCVEPGPNQTPPGTGMFRFPIRVASGGAFSEGPGLIAYSQSHFGLAGTILQGATWRFQTHYRDPAGPCGSGTNLTNALSVTFQ